VPLNGTGLGLTVALTVPVPPGVCDWSLSDGPAGFDELHAELTINSARRNTKR